MAKYIATYDNEMILDDDNNMVFDSQQKVEKAVDFHFKENYIEDEYLKDVTVFEISSEFKLSDKPDGLRYAWTSPEVKVKK